MEDSGPVNAITVDLQSKQADGRGIFGTDSRRITFSALPSADVDDAIPAQFVANWNGGRVLFETKDASNNPQPSGTFSALLSSDPDDATNDAKYGPFESPGVALSGPVLDDLDDLGNCLIRYTEFLQEIVRRYHVGGGSDNELLRLGQLYRGAEALDTIEGAREDHVVARNEDFDDNGADDTLGFVSAQFTGFQRVSWIPDDHGGDGIFRAPVSGLHPIFFGYESDDEFTLVQIANIPDQLEVEIDVRNRITLEADDDTQASIEQNDFYQGPPPNASEYVPFITALEEGFELFSVEFEINLDPLKVNSDFWPIDLDFDVNFTGDLVLDIWSQTNTSFTDDGA